MKLQHQVNFKPRRAKKPRNIPKNGPALATDEGQPAPTKSAVKITERELRFARALADTERHVRDASLGSLRTWLSSHAASLSDVEVDRLWKALFYCLWMADKRAVISAVVNDLVALADVGGSNYMPALFQCLSREWCGIDRLRMDKYYELTTAALKRAAADVVATETDLDFLKGVEGVMQMMDEKVYGYMEKGSLGLALHVLDKYVTLIVEPLLTRAQKLPGNQVHKVFDAMLESPLLMLSSTKGFANAASRRIKEQVLDQLPGLVGKEDLKFSAKAKRDMVNRVSKRVFATASAEDMIPDIRKELYDARLTLKGFVGEMDAAIAAEKDKKRGKNGTGKNKGAVGAGNSEEEEDEEQASKD